MSSHALLKIGRETVPRPDCSRLQTISMVAMNFTIQLYGAWIYSVSRGILENAHNVSSQSATKSTYYVDSYLYLSNCITIHELLIPKHSLIFLKATTDLETQPPEACGYLM